MYIITMNGRQLATCEDPEEAVNVILDNIDDETAAEYIDETEGEVKLFGMTYNASFVLQCVDPIAYECIKADIHEMWRDDMLEDLKEMKDGQAWPYYGTWVEKLA